MKDGPSTSDQPNVVAKEGNPPLHKESAPSGSETTIYRRVLDKVKQSEVVVDPEITFRIESKGDSKHRNSSSSEERIDTSDEMMEVDDLDINECFIADCQAEANRGRLYQDAPDEREPNPAEELIRKAEAAKAKIYTLPGNENQMTNYVSQGGQPESDKVMDVDQNYIMVGAHIDANLQERIKLGEYVDFARLLPRDRGTTDEHKMELVYKGGQTYFVPASERDASGITNFHKWEQAFRVFSNVYLSQNPQRAMELIQYNHVICIASSAYHWDNVYAYDKEFRMHMANYPNRNWSKILQQAWTMILKDMLKNDQTRPSSYSGKAKKEVCFHFNVGKCTSG